MLLRPLIKKSDYNTEYNEIKKKIINHDHSNKYIITQEFNKLTAENFATTLVQANLANKNDIAAFVKKTDFHDKLKTLNKKVTSSKTKHLRVEKQISDLTNKVAQISEKRRRFFVK